jgi:hypothetical protein
MRAKAWKSMFRRSRIGLAQPSRRSSDHSVEPGSYLWRRAHLGVETQCRWSDLAIVRTTPALFGLFSVVTVWAANPKIAGSLRPRSAAWYRKREPSFSDAIAAVRRIFWSAPSFSMSRHPPDSVKIPIALMERLTEALCYAA